MTIYSKKPVNWKVPKQYPSVFIFLRQGVGKAWTPHKHTRVLVCVLTPLKRKEQTLTPFSGAHAEQMRSWPLNAVTLIPSTVYTVSSSTETTPQAGAKGFWAPTLKKTSSLGHTELLSARTQFHLKFFLDPTATGFHCKAPPLNSAS